MNKEEGEYRVAWTHDGRDCEVIFDDWWCGYVKTALKFTHLLVSVGNPPILDAPADGVTYGVDDEGWIGFTTLQQNGVQVAPYEEPKYDYPEQINVWSKESVKEQVERLAVQVDHLEKFVDKVEYE